MPYPRTEVKVDLLNIKDEFLNHIQNPHNSRILITAPFGSGKSTFLSDFFASSEYSNKFITINLYPVNYAVAGNEDVFDLIKYDILSELLGKYTDCMPSLKTESFNLALQAQVFALHSEKSFSFIKSVISASTKIGKSALDVLKAVDRLNIDFQEFKKKMEAQNELTIKAFLESQGSSRGIHEMDDVSFVITQCIEDLKNEEEEKKDLVLIIDDLDRLDPEHIFRLFNVFSAHYDSVTEKNKFGFDKVIFVCDIANIQRMYAHRYGKEVDFNGYMDKFYSVSPFQFDSRQYLIEKLDQFLDAKRWRMDSGLESVFSSGSNFKSILRFVLLALINANRLTLRMLDHSSIYTISGSRTINPTHRPYDNYNIYLFHFYILIDYLRTLFPNMDQLESVFESVADNYGSDFRPKGMERYELDTVVKNIINACLPFILPTEEIFTGNKPNEENYLIECPEQPNCFFHYSLYPARGFRDYCTPFLTKITSSKSAGSSEAKINVFKLLITTLKICKERGIISN